MVIIANTITLTLQKIIKFIENVEKDNLSYDNRKLNLILKDIDDTLTSNEIDELNLDEELLNIFDNSIDKFRDIFSDNKIIDKALLNDLKRNFSNILRKILN